MDQYVQRAEHEIIRWESRGPALLSQVQGFVLGRFENAAYGLMPESVRQALGKAVEQSLAGLGSATALTVRTTSVRDKTIGFLRRNGHELEAADMAARHYRSRHLGYAIGEGGVLGIAGWPGLIADVPLLLMISLRLVQHVAICYSYDVAPEAERQYSRYVLLAGAAGDRDARHVALQEVKRLEDLLLRVSRKTLDAAAAREEVGRVAALASAHQLSRTLATQLAKRKALEMIPLLGALVGASFNASFVNDVGEAAYMSYRRRWIAERRGPL